MIKVLVFVEYYLPGYQSGALRTIANLVEQIGDEFEFHIITNDRDNTDLFPYDNVGIDKWNKADNSKVYYVSPDKRSISNLTKLINEISYDVLYLNSYFDPNYTIRPLLARLFNKLPKKPVIIAPRGEFSEGALIQKKYKKLLYLKLANILNLYDDVIWQASSQYEADEIRKAVGGNVKKLIVAPDLPPKMEEIPNIVKYKERLIAEPLKICFLSRISPKKNLDFALHIVSQVTIQLEFNLYGPKEDYEYWKLCEKLIKNMPANIKVNYRGNLEHDKVIQTFSKHDLFLFPTKGENFGHVILESMLAGTPVLISDTTPWKALELSGAGWDLPLGAIDPYIAVIEKLSGLNEVEYVSLRKRTYDYAKRISCDKTVLEANKRLFYDAVCKAGGTS